MKKNYVELSFKVDVFDTKNKKNKCIKKGVVLKMSCDPEYDLSCPAQVIDSKGMVVENECSVLVKDRGNIIVNHSYEEMKKIIWGSKKTENIVGFKFSKNKK